MKNFSGHTHSGTATSTLLLMTPVRLLWKDNDTPVVGHKSSYFIIVKIIKFIHLFNSNFILLPMQTKITPKQFLPKKDYFLIMKKMTKYTTVTRGSVRTKFFDQF